MVRCRRRQETSLHRKVCTAETKRDPMARFYRGYYNFAVDRRPDAHEFWTGVYSEQALVDMEGIELVIGDIPTDRQFNSLRRHCGHYAQAAKAMFVERARRMGEIKAAETRAAMTRVAGARGKPEDPVSHDIRKYATWPQQDGQPEGYRRRLLDSDDEDELALLPVDQRAAARSAKVIRRYVPSAAPERTAPPPEDPARMQAWLGRVIPVPVPVPAQSASSKAAARRRDKEADKRRRKTDHVKAVKGSRTLDQWLKGTRSADAAETTPTAPSTLPPPRGTLPKRTCMAAPSTSTKAPREEGRSEGGRKRDRAQAASDQASVLDLARIRAAEYERLRPERERDRRHNGSKP